jgi:hypothetical protein
VIDPAPADLTLHVDPQGDLLAATIACEEAVFFERYGVEPEALANYHAPYERSSTFLTLADDATGTIVAMARMVYPSPAGLITLVDIGEEPWLVDSVSSMEATGLAPDKVWDIATLAVRGAVTRRSYLYAAALYHGMLKVCAVNDVRGVVAVIDERVRRMLGALSLPFQAIPGTFTAPYWGSPATTPVWTNLADMLAHQRRRAPESYRLVTLGVGLDGIRIPPLEAFRIERSKLVELPSVIELPRQNRIDLRESADSELLES